MLSHTMSTATRVCRVIGRTEVPSVRRVGNACSMLLSLGVRARHGPASTPPTASSKRLVLPRGRCHCVRAGFGTVFGTLRNAFVRRRRAASGKIGLDLVDKQCDIW